MNTINKLNLYANKMEEVAIFDSPITRKFEKMGIEPKNAILKQYQKLLNLDEVDLKFDDGALEAIAEKALEKDTGARALRAIIEEFMLDIMYEIPKDKNIGTVTITREYIEGTGGPTIEMRTLTPPVIGVNTAPQIAQSE